MERPGPTGENIQSLGLPGVAPTVPFELRVSLAGMDPADDLHLVLPSDYAEDSIGRLLDRVFPEDEQTRANVESMFDVRANPDLPDIYAVIADAVRGWRTGLWELSISTDGADRLDPAGPVYSCLQRPCPVQEDPSVCSRPKLHLRVEQQYHALEYAVREGFWPSKQGLLGWLQELTVLYFIDKFECRLPAVSSGDQSPTPGVAGLQSNGLIAPSEETSAFVITEEGRGFIGRLLSETEANIDLYDHFKDVYFDDEAEDVCFGRGRGVDLRAQVYKTEGMDPIRTVFLLRLYDGSLDAFAGRWTGLIDDESFFDEVLEPVVNRHYVADALIGRIVESGYSYLEERREQAQQLASERRIMRRVWGNAPLPRP